MKNRFGRQQTEDGGTNDETTKRELKPLFIFIQGVKDCITMMGQIGSFVDENELISRTLNNNTMKIMTFNAESYRQLIRELKSDKVMHVLYLPAKK